MLLHSAEFMLATVYLKHSFIFFSSNMLTFNPNYKNILRHFVIIIETSETTCTLTNMTVNYHNYIHAYKSSFFGQNLKVQSWGSPYKGQAKITRYIHRRSHEAWNRGQQPLLISDHLMKTTEGHFSDQLGSKVTRRKSTKKEDS